MVLLKREVACKKKQNKQIKTAARSERNPRRGHARGRYRPGLRHQGTKEFGLFGEPKYVSVPHAQSSKAGVFCGRNTQDHVSTSPFSRPFVPSAILLSTAGAPGPEVTKVKKIQQETRKELPIQRDKQMILKDRVANAVPDTCLGHYGVRVTSEETRDSQRTWCLRRVLQSDQESARCSLPSRSRASGNGKKTQHKAPGQGGAVVSRLLGSCNSHPSLSSCSAHQVLQEDSLGPWK